MEAGAERNSRYYNKLGIHIKDCVFLYRVDVHFVTVADRLSFKRIPGLGGGIPSFV